ncbi:hypothetical protein ABZZ17_18610 [Streptomyces sp. NPDC006512]|uniref:hypothetical protein n=1 Tax=Streptomyces sp. NPDC006512 TaxID=3154307 RepID=UPI0033B18F54
MSAMNQRRILHAHFHLPHPGDADLYAQLLALAEDITPRVQALAPDAAHLDITGALRYWQLLWGFRTCGVTSCSALR